MVRKPAPGKTISRRSLLAGGLTTVSALAAAPLFSPRAWAQADREQPILVSVELSGGNDGLNTIVPYGDDAYYRHRPTIGIKPDEVRKLDDHFGLNPGLLGFERLWETDDFAIVHGCGYERPSYSHFTSMAYWHTAAPNRGDEFGWLGRLADSLDGATGTDVLINIGSSQSLAVKSRLHTPVVFDNPERFQRRAFESQAPLMQRVDESAGNPSRAFLNDVARSALTASAQIRDAWGNYRTPIDYGLNGMDLPKVAACIEAGLPARIYHVSYRNNAFDTHVQQVNLHRRILAYTADAINGFIRDLERIGQAHRVLVLVYSEFGRRVPENANLGTDHGSANVMFLAGKPVIPGHYGTPPSLTNLVDGDNLQHTVDFRQVYATAVDNWMQPGASETVLKGRFAPIHAIA
ncbi:MAG: DUF1501 domain-containing protein [Gammaproteobacteria bacterium]|nr:DUF1501 domain-containing protein [Gammaproteobacteria bacterium]MYH46807.1 DUF1501 domain-containing protein [Gammaproteobacteria bacterium]MYL13016.1 DUF1501 domain-containing protein [Gammaproteobacteria bacterium]